VIDGSDSPTRADASPQTPRRWMGLVLAVILGALVLFVLGWTAVRSVGPAPARAAPEAVIQRART
jgi:hypothetical protein